MHFKHARVRPQRQQQVFLVIVFHVLSNRIAATTPSLSTLNSVAGASTARSSPNVQAVGMTASGGLCVL